MDVQINLQLFAEEKTEKATPKKRRDVRERGNVFQSRELSSALVLIGCFAALYIFASFIFDTLKANTAHLLSMRVEDGLFSEPGVKELMTVGLTGYLKAVAPVAGVALCLGLVVSYVQVGFVFTPKPLQPNLNRINPAEGFKRIFSRRSFAQFIKSLLKISIVGYLTYKFIMDKYSELPRLLDMALEEETKVMGTTLVQLGIYAGMVLMVLAVLDYFYQRYEYEKSIMMTKQEVREEYKQLEGNPQVRSKIREKQRQISMRRMMAEVAKADVVITNPTHYAVALKYDPEKANAPFVVAKGKDLIAKKIKEIADKHSVYMVENPELARSLYETTDIGELIPPRLYQAVAEVLAFVYSMNKNS